ncbi:PepSY-associated TM helix domain-containing protein [Flavihumibacter solisilvae]|uniref:Peptidase M4 n=1 Tax=Flavihumibacter solisilvae TaxID=1349421 RepID=A0A0C1LCQ0_9BACT|nr:PepSY-associated TM helix domain-containing protein [Flavihumibacter solisilvae]KIC93288.1 peptidase M4 [Flavihumibacter solisilvae]
MSFRKTIGKIHLWLGLASGLIVVFLGITGCMLAFQKEIESLQSYRHVTTQSNPFLPPSAMLDIAAAEVPGKHAHSVSYQGPGKAAQVSFYNFEPENYYYIVFIDPYSGEVLKVKDMNRDFFRVLVMGHFYLWLPPAIGQPIVASATLIFLVMMITGIILWWPRNKAAARQRFSIKWNAKWKRKNYDLHNVLGFYMTWIAIFIAFTGLIWGFQWFAGSVYWLTSGGKKLNVFEETYSSKPVSGLKAGVPAEDLIWHNMKIEHPEAEIMEVHYPTHDSASIEVAINPDAGTYWKADYRYFDRYTLKEIPVTHLYGRFKDAGAAEKLMRMNYDVHVGQILGLRGKILAFFGSLIAASLPVTGFVIWWGRRRKRGYVRLQTQIV